MVYSDDESDLSEAFDTLIILFSLITRFTIFFKSLIKAIRNIENRRLIILKVSKTRRRPASPESWPLDNYISLFTILIDFIDSLYNDSKISSLFEDVILGISTL